MMAGVVRPVASEVVGHHVDPIHRLQQKLLAEPFERARIGRGGHRHDHRPPFLRADGVELFAKAPGQSLEADDFLLGVGILPVEVDPVVIIFVDDRHD